MQFVKTNVGLVNIAFVERIDRAPDGKAILRYESGPAISAMSFEELEDCLGEVIPNTTTAHPCLWKGLMVRFPTG